MGLTSNCPKCGYLNVEGAGFCQSCGTPLAPRPISPPSLPTPPPYYEAPPRRGMTSGEKTVIIVGVLVAIIIVGTLAAGVFYYSFLVSRSSTVPPTSQTSPVVITGVNAQINYASSSDNYFGPASQSIGGTGLPLNLNEGQSFYYSFKLIMGGLYQSHSIDTVRLSTPGFALLTVSPALPYTMSSGSSVTITITAQAPYQSFYGAIAISVSTH